MSQRNLLPLGVEEAQASRVSKVKW